MTEQQAEKAQRVRIAITMARTDYDNLRQWAASESTTVSDLMRRAIATRRYLDERTRSGAVILVERDGIQREVVFR